MTSCFSDDVCVQPIGRLEVVAASSADQHALPAHFLVITRTSSTFIMHK